MQYRNTNKIYLSIFNQTTLEVCEGQALDKEFENDIKIKENEYLTMVEKTGALLGTCCCTTCYTNEQNE